jgi:hypothetical protein
LQAALLVISPMVLLLGAAFALLAVRSVHPDTVAMDRAWAARA